MGPDPGEIIDYMARCVDLYLPSEERTPATLRIVRWDLCDGMQGAGGDWFLFRLETDPDYRRRGFARRLMTNVLDQFREKRSGGRIFLRPQPFNAPDLDVDALIAFYQSLGFESANSIQYPDLMVWRAPETEAKAAK